jgi:hypothetical protein
MRRTGRRSYSEQQGKRGLFGGNLSIRYGLITVIFCVVVVQFYYRAVYTAISGPIDDVFLSKKKSLVIVYSTGGYSGGTRMEDYAGKVSLALGRKLSTEIPVYPDTAVTEKILKERSLILYGPVEQNSVAYRMRDYFPFSFSRSAVVSGSAKYSDEPWRLVFIIPNPYNNSQYVLVYTGMSVDNVLGINFLGHPNFVRADSTDYVLADGHGIAEQGFFNKEDKARWRLIE